MTAKSSPQSVTHCDYKPFRSCCHLHCTCQKPVMNQQKAYRAWTIWLLLDSEGETIIFFSCLPIDKPTRQRIVPNPRSQGRTWLYSMTLLSHQCQREAYGDGRETRGDEGRGSRMNVLYTQIKFLNNKFNVINMIKIVYFQYELIVVKLLAYYSI